MLIVLYFGISRNNSLIGAGLAMFAGIFATLGLALLTIGLVNLSRAYEVSTGRRPAARLRSERSIPAAIPRKWRMAKGYPPVHPGLTLFSDAK